MSSCGSFIGFVFVPSEKSQLTPWPISATTLTLNMIVLYPTYKWNRFSLISSIWALIGSVLSLWRVFAAKQNQMAIAHSIPCSLPLTIGAIIIRLTLEDGTKSLKQRWKTFLAVANGKSPEYTLLGLDGRNNEPENVPRVYHRIEEISRLLALFVDFIAMTYGLMRVWSWWYPFDAITDTMCLATFPRNFRPSCESNTNGFIINDWNAAEISENCIQFQPAVGWFLIIVYTAIYVTTFVGVAFMRGYFIWAIGSIGAAILIVLSGVQATYSTQGLCIEFVAILMQSSLVPSTLSNLSLITLWWHRFGAGQWFVHLFTIHA
ncbi:5158_t:CDS:1 [Paraglomus brasilianum]|uniref:5158_t:CDS:1 n=1 Tax=Paraglomus brasilianum TaxID=144538 RepID=A0A9N9D950_9GLOM|nr:5158_t:CDS:1 [Paraglomus brasilianum]